MPSNTHRFDTTPLPDHARVIAGPDVWMEGDGVSQFARTATLPGCVRAVGMPDLHIGKGPVGAVFATTDRVYPHLLGGDVGCGVRVFATNEDAKNRDAVERRVRKAWDEDPLEGCDRAALLRAVWSRGIAGLIDLADVPDPLRALAEEVANSDVSSAPEGASLGREGSLTGAASQAGSLDWGPTGAASQAGSLDGSPTGAASQAGSLDRGPAFGDGFEEALGSIGGGNHFVEIARVDDVRDAALAERHGLVRGCLVTIAHSGSRGLGTALARRYGDATLTGGAIDAYLDDVAGASQFACVNRFLLGYRLLRALGAARRSKITGTFDLVHNDVRKEPLGNQSVWVHRKGAAPAHSDAPTIVLGSRGAPSWVLVGLGAEEGLRSVAHGAGRRMGRAEALSKLKNKYRRAELTTTKLGGRVVCEDTDLLYEEHPDAYKPIEPVVASLVNAGLAVPVASLVPVVTVKR